MRTLSPTSPWRDGRIERVNERYDAYLAEGFATADFEDQPEPERLQCRTDLDRTNWIGLVIKCQAAIAAELGDLPCDPPIRCTSNRMYAVSYADALGRMFVLLDQVGRAQANWWRLKDACRAEGLTLADLNAIDLEEGWP